MEKVWQQLKEQLTNIEFASYDYDLDDESEQYQVGDVLPVIILEKNNQELTRFVGEKTTEQIIKEIENYEK
jgi:hypothetical protein